MHVESWSGEIICWLFVHTMTRVFRYIYIYMCIWSILDSTTKHYCCKGKKTNSWRTHFEFRLPNRFVLWSVKCTFVWHNPHTQTYTYSLIQRDLPHKRDCIVYWYSENPLLLLLSFPDEGIKEEKKTHTVKEKTWNRTTQKQQQTATKLLKATNNMIMQSKQSSVSVPVHSFVIFISFFLIFFFVLFLFRFPFWMKMFSISFFMCVHATTQLEKKNELFYFNVVVVGFFLQQFPIGVYIGFDIDQIDIISVK